MTKIAKETRKKLKERYRPFIYDGNPFQRGRSMQKLYIA